MVRNVLILYYSQFGNTAKLASAIHRQTGADILRLQVSQGYFPDEEKSKVPPSTIIPPNEVP